MKVRSFQTLNALLLVVLAGSAGIRPTATAQEMPLEIAGQTEQGWLLLHAPGETGRVYTLEASTNLLDWSPIASLHDGVFRYPDPVSTEAPTRFYRVSSTRMTSTNDWKNQVHFPEDSFLSGGEVFGPDFRWIKFAIDLSDPTRVYYQDSAKYPFHYDFATARMEPFKGMTPAEFDQVALHTNRQEILLGTLLFPPYPNDKEYGIQFVGLDPYPAEMISAFYELVQSTVVAEPGVSSFYVPAFEQRPSTEANRDFYESKGIRLASPERWIPGSSCYSRGWALGTLKFFEASEIQDAFVDGRLSPQDILLTDGVPAEIPVLAGVLTLSPSTPNSHVAIQSRSFRLPFAYIADEAEQARIRQLADKEVLFRVDPYGCNVSVIEVDSTLDPSLREQILELKQPPTLNITAKERYGAIHASTDNLTPADIKYFGGKASNFGFLRRAIPERSHEAIAFSFDLWDAFLDQTLPGGRTLREEIDERISKHSYPPNFAALREDLEAIQSLITRTASFTPEQKEAIVDALKIFDQNRNIRFRSSTNVEDSEQFTGAGLYDSYSGCLADDLDDDNDGPSVCDPTEDEERGVFRAIQKVYASFYNENAVVERLRHRVNEDEVGMAILVHHSTPDPIEMANGVATVQVNRGGDFDDLSGDLVTQKGAVSITNPESGARPEVISIYHHALGSGGFLQQRSDLVPLGAYVMEWDAEYKELIGLFARVADAFHEYFPQKRQFHLDFEFKKVEPGVLDVKQVREIPANLPPDPLGTFLLNRTNEYAVFQGEAADVFSNHRLKSFWAFQTKNLRLSSSNLVESLYTRLEADYLNGEEVQRLEGAPGSFPEASHSQDGDWVIDRWAVGTGTDRRVYELRTQIISQVAPDMSPVLTLNDLRLELAVEFAEPQPMLEWDFDGLKPATTTRHLVVLEPKAPLTSTNYLQERTISKGGVAIRTSFYWPEPPSDAIGYKTAPLVQWVETRIEGLTSEPIVLKGEYSQTYRPGHHNFFEEFIFEPALEPGIAPAILQELEAAGVRLIHAQWAGAVGTPAITILDRDGNFRSLE